VVTWLEPGRSLLQAGAGAPASRYAAIVLPVRPGLRPRERFLSGLLILSFALTAYTDTPTTATGIGAAPAPISFAARLRFTVITFSSTCTVTLASPQ
jgi:hypothetical protein